MREGQLALCSRSASSILVPVADYCVTAMFDQIKIVGNDFLDCSAETVEVSGFPSTKLAGFGCSQVFHLVLGRIVYFVTQGFEHRSDQCAPAFAEIRRVFDGACEIEKHERRLSAIQGCRSTQIWRGLGRVFQRFSYALSEIPSGASSEVPSRARDPYSPAESFGAKRFLLPQRAQRSQRKKNSFLLPQNFFFNNRVPSLRPGEKTLLLIYTPRALP